MTKNNNKQKNLLQALIFDTIYDKYLGVVIYVRIFEGTLNVGQKICFFYSSLMCKIDCAGVNTPKIEKKEKLVTGEIGWFSANIRDMSLVKVGDAVLEPNEKKEKPLFLQKITQLLDSKPNIYCNIFPEEKTEFNQLKKAINELQLQDSGLSIENTNSQFLGRGFCCGFFGLLHKEIVCERLEKEFFCKNICTSANPVYQIITKNKKNETIKFVSDIENFSQIEKIKEPIINIKILVPQNYLSLIIQLCQKNRGIFVSEQEKINSLYELVYTMPFVEFIKNFHEKINHLSSGYAFFEYQLDGFQESDIVKVDILLNGLLIPDLSFFSHSSTSLEQAREICQNIKKNISRHTFSIAIQACINKKVIVRENISAIKKNVTGNLYGGDRTRKMKLWEKQKQGKKKCNFSERYALKQQLSKKY